MQFSWCCLQPKLAVQQQDSKTRIDSIPAFDCFGLTRGSAITVSVFFLFLELLLFDGVILRQPNDEISADAS